MEEETQIADVARILADNSVLERHKLQFVHKLGVKLNENDENSYKSGTLGPYEYFYKALDIWVTTNGETCTVQALCKVIDALRCELISQTLRETFNEKSIICNRLSSSLNVQQNAICTDIKWPALHPPSENFIKREKEDKELQKCYAEGVKLVLICGNAGIGKTELCRKFAQDFVAESNSQKGPKSLTNRNRCIWLLGDSKDTLRDSLMKIATRFAVAHGSVKITLVFESLLSSMFEYCSNLLVVIDNVDEELDEVIEIANFRLNYQFQKLFFIITSRDNKCVGSPTTNTIKKIELDVFSREQAESMLRESLKNSTDSEIASLCKLFDNFPLALAQAITYIREQQDDPLIESYSVKDYVEEYKTFREIKSKMLSQPLNQWHGSRYSLDMLSTWDFTIEKMDDYAKKLLNILAFVEPDGINMHFLKLVCLSFSDTFTDEKFNNAYRLISRYSIIKPTKANKLFVTIHRIVQDVLKVRMTTEETSQECTKLVQSVVEVWTERPFQTEEEKELRIDELRHVLTVWKQAITYSSTRDSFGILILETLYHLSILGQFQTAIDFSAVNFQHFQPYLDSEKQTEAEKLIIWVVMQYNGMGATSVNNMTKEDVIKDIDGFCNSKLSVGAIESIKSSVVKYFLDNAEILLLQVDRLFPYIFACELWKIVTILVQDPIFLQKWERFCDMLQSEPNTKIKLNLAMRDGTMPKYDIISNLLMSWLKIYHNRTVGDLENILRQIDCIKIADTLVDSLERDFIIQQNVTISRSEVNITWPIFHGIRVVPANFSGRENELKLLHNLLHKGENLILVCGFAGIGKTELCRKFISDIHVKVAKGPPVSCIWLEGESVEALKDSIQSIAYKLGFEAQSSNFVDLFVHIVELCLENCFRLIIVFDNVDTMYSDLRLLIDRLQFQKRTFIIVTSRERSILESEGRTLLLDVLNRIGSRDIVQISIDVTDSEADELCALLDCYPLALQQAISYIREERHHVRTRNYGVSDYIAEFEKERFKMLGLKLNKFEHRYETTTLIAWGKAFEKLGEKSLQILRIIACIDSDKIDLKFLEELCCKYYLMNDFDYAFELFYKYSLVQLNESAVTSHRLMREVVRMKFADPAFPKNLFDAILLIWSQRELSTNSSLNWNESKHISTVCRFAFGSSFPFDSVDKSVIHKILVQLLEWDRVECTVALTKLHFHDIDFSGLSKADMITVIGKL